MTIARILLAMIPIGAALAIVRANLPALDGFIYAWASFLSVFGLSVDQVNVNEAPASFRLGILAGLFSVIASVVFSVFAFCVAWEGCGPGEGGDEQ